MVVLFHYYLPLNFSEKITFFSKNGCEAVTFFFFISGFVMIVANSAYFKSENYNFSKLDFYIKRIARIYPLYLFALILLTVFHYGVHPLDTATVKYRLPFEILAIQRLLYTGSFNYPGWTISCEFFFYFLFPFLIVFMRKRRNAFKNFVWIYFISSLIISHTLYFISQKSLSGAEKKLIGTLYLHPVFLSSIFICGMWCGKLYIENRINFFKNNWNNVICALVSIVLIFAIKYYIPVGSYLSGGLMVPIYFMFITSVTSFTKTQSAIFSSKPFVFLGEISYGIYILQYPVNVFFSHYVFEITNGQSLLYYLLTLIGFASVTHYLVEKPFKKIILDRYNTKKQQAVSLNLSS